MGLNATTFVPAYTSGEVLTAADLTVTNSGAPVFADAAARDAAFGGTGEKVLAEGQLAYLEDSNIVQYYDGSVWATLAPQTPGKIVQIVDATHATQVTSSTSTFVDTGLTVTITPQFATSTILVLVNQNGCYKETNNTWQQLQLLRGATAVALFSAFGGFTNDNGSIGFGSCSTAHLDSPATTSATTYKTQQRSFNNNAIVGVQGSSSVSTITAIEISA